MAEKLGDFLEKDAADNLMEIAVRVNATKEAEFDCTSRSLFLLKKLGMDGIISADIIRAEVRIGDHIQEND